MDVFVCFVMGITKYFKMAITEEASPPKNEIKVSLQTYIIFLILSINQRNNIWISLNDCNHSAGLIAIF